jgi:hypothetical protein
MVQILDKDDNLIATVRSDVAQSVIDSLPGELGAYQPGEHEDFTEDREDLMGYNYSPETSNEFGGQKDYETDDEIDYES